MTCIQRYQLRIYAGTSGSLKLKTRVLKYSGSATISYIQIKDEVVGGGNVSDLWLEG
jgi:hypothetical protein